jgi:hypothetical protein
MGLRSRRVRTETLGSGWPDGAGGGPRVVVECRDDVLADAAAGTLSAAGYHVMSCVGPDDRHRCPLLDGGGCPLVEGADVVVDMLGFGDDDGARVLGRLKERYPDTPVVAEASTSERARHADDLSGVFIAESPMRGAGLLTQVAVAQWAREQSEPLD